MKKLNLLICFIANITIAKALDAPTLKLPVDGENYIKYDMNLVANTVTGATKYIFEIDTVSGFNSSFRKLDSSNQILYYFNAVKLGFGKKYYWRAKAKNDIEVSNWSSTWSFTVQKKLEIFSPVNNFNSDYHSPSITVRTFGTGPLYRIDVDTVSTFNSGFLRRLYPSESNSTVQAYDMPYGKKVYFRTWAFILSGDTTDFSETRIINIQAAPKPELPVNATTGVDTSVAYLFAIIKGSTAQVEVQIDVYPLFNTPVTYTKSTGSFKNLKFDTTYFWRVRQITNAGKNISFWSETFSFTTKYQLTKPIITSPINNSANNNDSLKIIWLPSTPSPVSNYYIETDTNSDFKTPFYYYTNNTTVNLSSLKGKTNNSLFIRIRAINDYGKSPWSDVLKINNLSTGIIKNIEPKDIVVYYLPNEILIKSMTENNFNLELLSIDGKIVKTIDSTYEAVLKTDELSNGIYLLNIEKENTQLFRRKICIYR